MATVFSLGDLARRVHGRVVGDPARLVRDVATLEDAGPDDLSFLTNPRYRAAAADSRAGALLVGPNHAVEGRDLLEAPEPYLALARLLEWFHPAPAHVGGIDPSAHVADGARLGRDVWLGAGAVLEAEVELGDRVSIGAGCVVCRGSRVGDDSRLMPNVVVYPGTRIGARCLIHSGVVLGADGFGFATVEGEHHKIPQLGRVVVEDDVEIGANSTVDRGALGETVIGRSSKIDNLVMIAHGVRVGGGALLAAQAGIAGSTRLGRNTVFAGQSGAAGHLTIGDRSIVAAKTAVFDDLADGSFVAGIPAVDHRRWKRSQAVVRRLPELHRELRDLRTRMAELERRFGADDTED